MSRNGNPPVSQGFLASGHALRDPHDRPQYPSPSSANGSFPDQRYAPHLQQLQHQLRVQMQTNLHVPQGESESYSFRSGESGSVESEATEREKQRLVQGWAFNSQPPSLGVSQPQPQPRRSVVGDGAERDQRGMYHPPYGPHPETYGYAQSQHPQLHPSYQRILPYPVHQRPSVDRSQSPMNHSASRHGSPHHSAYDHRMYPGVSYSADSNRQNSPRMGGAMAIDHLVMEGRHPTGQPRRYSPLDGGGGAATGRGTALAGLAAGMASPEQSFRSSRTEPEPEEQSAHPGEAGLRGQPPEFGSHVRQPPYLPAHIHIADAELLTSLRYGPLSAQPRPTGIPITRVDGERSQWMPEQSARSSVVPGTPSERAWESVEGQETTSRIGTPRGSRRPGVGNGWVGDGLAGSRVIAIASSPEFEVPDPVSEGSVRVSLDGAGDPGVRASPTCPSPTQPEESFSLEPTQRNEDIVASPVAIRQDQPALHKSPVKTPGKSRILPQPQPHQQPDPRPVITSKPAVETDDDTFIQTGDRKVAFKKRSNAEIDNCMFGVPVPPPAEGASPNKKKKTAAARKPVGVEEAGEVKKQPGRGELQNRKTVNVMIQPKLAAANAKPTESPVKKQKVPVAKSPPVVDHLQPPHPYRLFLPTESSETSIADTTISISARVAPYRRLQKTSAGASSAQLSGALSLKGIDSWERMEDVEAKEEVQLEATLPAGHSGMMDDADLAKGPGVHVPSITDMVDQVTEPRQSTAGAISPEKMSGRSRSTSLTSAPDSDDDQPRVETLVIPSPAPLRTYKSPSKKRKKTPVMVMRDTSSGAEQASESKDEDSPKQRKSTKKQGRPRKKILSPTASPPARAKGKGNAPNSSNDTSVDSLSDVPLEEKWDDVPAPMMKDDPRDRDFRPAGHSQIQASPTRKIQTRREPTTSLPVLRAKRVLGRWNGDFYTGQLIGKENRKYVLQFDDTATEKLDHDDLRQCIFHVGDQISQAHGTKPRLPVSGLLEVVGPVDPALDMSNPLMADDMLVVRAENGTTYEIPVRNCSFSEDQEDALDSRIFEESELDELCRLSESDIPVLKRGKEKFKPVDGNAFPRRTALRRQHRSDSRLDRPRPLYNFAFVISCVNVEEKKDKKVALNGLKAKIKEAGGRVVDDFFDFYPKPRGERISADDIALTKHYHKLNGIFLLVLPPKEPKSPFLTEKYMMALALGIPCLSAAYIDELLSEEETASWRSFLMSAGLSLQLKSEVSQIVDLNTGEGPKHLIKKIDAEGVVRRPFANRSFLIRTGVKEIIPYVCAAMGAESVIIADSKTRGRKGTSATPSVVGEIASGRSASDVDYIIVPDDAPKSRSKKDAAKICNVEWVKQCLIMGKLYPPSIISKPAPSTDNRSDE